MDDSPKVEMLRSVKGKDMLLVNDYLYHYDDRNSKAYRWVCSRRKDIIPCRVRIYTTLIDEWDLTRHKLVNLVGEHPHAPAEQDSILRAREKKRQADAEGLPCTLSNKSLKRRHQRKEEEEEKKNTNQKKKKKISGEDSSDSGNDGEDIFKEFIAIDNIDKAAPKAEEKSVLMLKTSKGYHMVAVEGCVYRLDGKSMFSCTYRWKCFRSKDLQCTGRIYTECLANGMHRFKPFRVEENKHNHQPYSEPKIEALIKRNNIKILHGNNENFASKVVKTPAVKEKVALSKGPPLSVGKGGGNVLSISANINLTPKLSLRREKAAATAALYREVQNPYDALATPKEGGVTKFFFLPSLKGNRILVLDNMIFHYDSRGSVSNRSYWTCMYRRDKEMKCTCRLTTEATETINQIVKISGGHSHEKNHRPQIEKRLNMNWSIRDKKTEAPKKENEPFMENDNSLYKTTDEEDDDNNANNDNNDNNNDFGADISEFLKINPMKSEKDTKPSIETTEGLGDNQEITIVECKTEIDPFYDTIEYVEMERLNASQYQGDYETEKDVEDNALKNRPKRKIKKSSRYSDPEDDEDDEDYSPPKKAAAAITKQTKTQTLSKRSKRTKNLSYNPDNIDITKTSKLRSAKGGELLCVDGFIYHLKSISPTTRTYWACIKSKDRRHKCLARVTTITTEDNNLKVVHLSNSHTHGVSEHDIKKRLFNEFTKSSSSKSDIKSKQIMEKSLSELNPEFAEMLTKPRRLPCEKGTQSMKLYAVSDGPPSLAVRMCLKALNLNYELHNVDYIASEHMSEEYAKMNPQKEIPVLDDNGFYLPESIAIMQYLCDKYAPNGVTPLYPKDPKERALVNHRLCFNMGFYYSSIGAYSMAPIFFDYQRTEMGLKKVKNALQVFETYLQRLGTKYAAADHLTIADFGLISATLCLEAIGFDLTPYPLITKWYENFKKQYKDLWEIANGGMQEIKEFEANPPDLSHMNHPFHPTRKSKA